MNAAKPLFGTLLFGTLLLGLPATALAAPGQANGHAIAMFLVFVAFSLAITWFAARRTRSTADFYTAGGRISGFRNGLAITGDWCSSAALMGIAALIYTSGFDGLIYSVVPFGAWPLMMFLLAERLRNLGRYTVADAIALRLARAPTRILMASAGLAFVVGYLIVQMVGAGTLISALFGIDYVTAEVVIGVLIVVYVAFGGMLATTYVQLVKAVLLVGGATLIAGLTLARSGGLDALYAAAVAKHPSGHGVLEPGGMLSDPVSAVSCGLMLFLGGAAMPHVLMRFFTVPNAVEARRSVLWAATFIGWFYLLTFVLGFGAVAYVLGEPRFSDAGGALLGGANMAAIHLASAMGGDILLGFISAVAFATIVAVVAGLTIAGASAISHDLYASVLRHGRAQDREIVLVSRLAALGLGILGVVLGIAFRDQNIAYMIVLPFTISSTVFFPILVLTLYWPRLTTTGAVVGGWTGLATAVALLVFGPTIWHEILGHPAPLFPYKYPALFSVSASFLTMIGVSLLDHSARARAERAAFDEQLVRAQTGVMIAPPAAH
ncbi:MAG: cation acetate symporter [Gammaproteobacteria bacterium]